MAWFRTAARTPLRVPKSVQSAAVVVRLRRTLAGIANSQQVNRRHRLVAAARSTEHLVRLDVTNCAARSVGWNAR